MAIRNILSSRKLGAVYLISKQDDAIDWAASDEKAYKQGYDEKHLKLLPGKEPTRFLCNFELDAKGDSEVQDAMIVGVNEEGRMKPGLGSYALCVVRRTLRDIKNPASLPEAEHLVYKRNADGTVADETLDILARLGILGEIAAAYSQLTKEQITSNKADTKN